MRIVVHPDLATARRHVAALGRSSHYTRGDRPSLPRCDSYKWNDREIRRGRRVKAACPCPSRDAPVRRCPYVTRAAALIIRLRAEAYGVVLPDWVGDVRGQVIDVDGTPTTITDEGARDVTSPERGSYSVEDAEARRR